MNNQQSVKMKDILSFMQREDRNGSWSEWFNEIQSGESTFDTNYIVNVLTEWYNESKEEKYANMIQEVKSFGRL